MKRFLPQAIPLVLVLLGLLAGLYASIPPAPIGADAAADRFSAARARSTLERLMADGRPHPTGSPENAAVRDRIVAELQSLGLTPQVQSAFVCGAFRHYCGTVDNVLARIDGLDSTRAVLLNAHYDTQAATPGAADCMAGVASVLETARALSATGPPATDVILLLNDGEEAGLLGSTAFVEQNDQARDVGLVINLEARGSAGPSVPAYTVGGDRALLARHLASSRRPAPGSAFLAITRFLPLTNDLAVFERLGVPGVTFGFLRNPRHYHTPRDDLAHLSQRSLQQHGENALRLARSWMRSSPAAQGNGANAAFFSVGPWTAAWAVDWTLPLAIAVAAGWLVLGLALFRSGRSSVKPLLWGLGYLPVALLTVFFGSAVLNLGRKTITELPNAVVAHPAPTFVGFGLFGFALAVVVALPVKRRLATWGGWLGTWLVWSALAVVLADFEPRAAYLLLAPAAVALIAGAIELALDRRRRAERDSDSLARLPTWVAVAPAAFTVVLWIPHLAWLLDLVGLGNLPPIAALVGWAATTTAPALRRGAGPALGALGVTGLALVGVGTRLPTFTAEHPQYANLIYHLDVSDGDVATARWIFTGYPLAEPIAEAAEFENGWTRSIPWAPHEAGLVAAAPVLDLAPPVLDVARVETQADGLRVEGRLRSPRGAPVIQLVFDATSGVSAVEVEGVAVPVDAAGYALFDPEFAVYTVWTLPPEGVRVAWTQPRDTPVRCFLADRSWGTPAGTSLAAGRPDTSVPVGTGDATVVSIAVELDAPEGS